MGIWGVFASSLASIIFGIFSFFVLRSTGNHRDGQRKIASGKITVCVLQSIALYTLFMCLLGQWVFKIPVSETIHSGFGDERAAWLLLGTAIDVTMRLYQLMDPE
jgi:hypothetical protein